MTALRHPIPPFFAFLALALAAAAAHAAVPGQVHYQGLLLDAEGSLVHGDVDLVFRIFDVETGGAALWSESHGNVAVLDGVYEVALGSVVPVDGGLLEGGALYLEIQVEGETLTPRQRLLAVPYAIRAGTAELAESLAGPLDADLVVGTTKAGQQDSWNFLTWLLGSDQTPGDTSMSVGPTCGNPVPRGFCVDDNVGLACQDDGVCGTGSCQLTSDCVFNMFSVNEGLGVGERDETQHAFNDSWEYSFHYDTFGQKLEHNWDLSPAHFQASVTGASGSFTPPTGTCSESRAICTGAGDCAGTCNLTVVGETLSFSGGARGRVVSWDGSLLEYVHIFGEVPQGGETVLGDDSGATATLGAASSAVYHAWRPFQWVSDVWSGLRSSSFSWWVTPSSRALAAHPVGVAVGRSGKQTNAALQVYNSFGRSQALTVSGDPKSEVGSERLVYGTLDLELEAAHYGGSATGLEIRARRQGSANAAQLSNLTGVKVSTEHGSTGANAITKNLYGVDVDLDVSGADETDEVRSAFAVRIGTPGACGAGSCVRQHAGIVVDDQEAIGRRYSHALFVRAQSPDSGKGNLVLEGGGWNDGHLAVGHEVANFMDHLWRDQANEVWRSSTDAAPSSAVDGDQLLTGAMETSDPCGTSPAGRVFFNDADATGFYCFCDKSGAAAQLHQPTAACF